MPAVPSPLHRLLVHTILAGCVAIASALPHGALAADGDTTLELRPHCERDPGDELSNVFGGPIPTIPGITTPLSGTNTPCGSFAVKDPLTRQTDVLRESETLDMDLVIRNPSRKSIARVRAWLAYDPSLLEGTDVTIANAFTLPSPDEQGFSPTDGYIKIGAGAPNALSAETIVVARIRMKVLRPTVPQTVISFYGTGADPKGETAVVSGSGDQESTLLRPPLGSLLVRFNATAGGASSAADAALAPPFIPLQPAMQPASMSSVPSSVSLARSSLGEGGSVSSVSSQSHSSPAVFSLLQVQNLRVTCEGTSAYLAWDALKSAELTGYNLYYGTVSGEYIQRRSVAAEPNTLSIRNLPQSTRYYFAIRGFNKESKETEFSQEVAIVICKPESSTSPLVPGNDKGPRGKAPKTGGKVAGDTGTTSTLLLFAILSAGIGTALALRRQFRTAVRS